MDVMLAFLDRLTGTLFDWNSRMAAIYLAASVVIAWAVWLRRGKPQGFVEFLCPREVYLHRSNIVDLKIFLFNILLGLAGFLTLVAVTPLVASSVIGTLSEWTRTPPSSTAPTLGLMALASVVIILTNDFCVYWVHRIHHEARVLWPFHSVHHSAEVMTPLTVYRKHPVYDLFSRAVKSVIIGAVQGVMLFAVVGEISVITIGSAHAGYVIFNMLGSNLRHTHIWLSYGQVLEHILISPAQHQIHHSIERRHYNKNYGEVFAVWDWMFGTLYVPRSRETLHYGLSDETGTRVAQPHPTLRAALVEPFRDCWAALWKGTSRDPEHKAGSTEEPAR